LGNFGVTSIITTDTINFLPLNVILLNDNKYLFAGNENQGKVFFGVFDSLSSIDGFCAYTDITLTEEFPGPIFQENMLQLDTVVLDYNDISLIQSDLNQVQIVDYC